MRNPENIGHVAQLLPDYLGFIFFEKSPRFVGNDFTMPATVHQSIKKVGVFVNEHNDTMLAQVVRLKLDYLQLHGSESVQQCYQLKKSGVKIIKVFSVHDTFNFEITKPYKELADYFLFDTQGKYHGGNAQKFNWAILNRYDQDIPFFLSGGISPDNVQEVYPFHALNIHALDINSGVESAPGLKNVSKIELIKNSLHTFQ